jgi:hypothetical protein
LAWEASWTLKNAGGQWSRPARARRRRAGIAARALMWPRELRDAMITPARRIGTGVPIAVSASLVASCRSTEGGGHHTGRCLRSS